MLRRLPALLTLAAFTYGSWIGLGKPWQAKISAAAQPYLARLSPESLLPHHLIPEPPPPTPRPADDTRPPLDPSLLPDPNPWPELNADRSTTRAWLLSEGPSPRAANGRKLVTLTFDDGPFPETTPVVLRVLAKHQVHATFFWIGRYLDGTGERAVATRAVAAQVKAAGHLIGTHTHDHERLIGIPHAQVLAQIDRGMLSIERAIGVRPSVFRPPFGQLDPYGQAIAKERGLTLVLWNVETQDLRHTDADAMARNLEEQIDFSGGGIVLMHDIRFSTADAVDKLLTWIDHHRWDPNKPEQVGYDVVDFAEFTRATAASPQPFPNRAALEEARAAAWRKEHPESKVPAVVVGEGSPAT